MDNQILLPKSYLSWSQMQIWKTNPERYKREYFEKGEKLNTKFLRFGKGIAEMIELGTHGSILPDLIVYTEREYEINISINGVPILSFLDSYDPIDNVFREVKTGKIPWTQVKVQKHDQLTFYATALHAKHGGMPEYCDLDWIETVENQGDESDFFSTIDKKINCTGKLKTFRRNFDFREIERMEADILKVALEISEAYRAFIGEL